MELKVPIKGPMRSSIKQFWTTHPSTYSTWRKEYLPVIYRWFLWNVVYGWPLLSNSRKPCWLSNWMSDWLAISLSRSSSSFCIPLGIYSRVRPRFFDQVGHETMHESWGISISSLNHAIVRIIKIINRTDKNWAKF